MIRIILYFIGLAGVAAGLAWLADRPGNLVIDWQGYVIETSVFRAIVMLLFLLGLTIVLWTLLRQLLASPARSHGCFAAGANGTAWRPCPAA